MPCVQKMERAEWNGYVRTNRVDVDRFAGVEDPVDVVCLIHDRPPLDPLKNYLPYCRPVGELYAALSAANLHRLIERTRRLLTSAERRDRETGEGIAPELACFTNADLHRIQDVLVVNGSLYPGVVYRGAGTPIVDRLVDLLDASIASGQPPLHGLLEALAWTEHEQVIHLFTEWLMSAPSWAERLHWPPHAYAEIAGWSVAAGAFQRLYPVACHELVERGRLQSAVTVVRAAGQQCGLCERELFLLFDLDTRTDALAFLDLPPGRICIPFCHTCSLHGALQFDIGLDGSWAWTAQNLRPAHLPVARESLSLPVDRLMLGAARAAITAAIWTVPNRHSQLGGMPTWVQDAEYPRCRGCGGIMRFVGQLAFEDLMPAEGLLYAFLCLKCKKAATGYQST